MKKTILTVLTLLILALTFSNIPTFLNTTKVSATTEERCVTPAGPNVSTEPMPENYTTEDYLNTTNPYADYADDQEALEEVNASEGKHPLYVLVFGDEEERATTRYIRLPPYGNVPLNWEQWAEFQLERGDEALVANFGIDIRILDFLEWDSNDSIQRMDDPGGFDLCDELVADNGHYLRTWYNGESWSSYVDAIIGITQQSTPNDPDPIAGLAPSLNELDQGIIFVLLKWQCYWKDDNLVQHEVSHLYYAPDHHGPQPPAPCCAMAYHSHYQYYIWENGFWWVLGEVPCSYTSYYWCTTCNQTIEQNTGRYPMRTLTISSSSGGTTYPFPGTYAYSNGSSATVWAYPDLGCTFECWLLDGATVHNNPKTITMDSDHTLEAYFSEPVCAMKTKKENGLFYVPTVASLLLKVEMLFDNAGLAGDQTGGTSPYGSIENYPDGYVGIDDIFFVAGHFGYEENESGWDYMADVIPDGYIGIDDIMLVSSHYGNSGTYITSLTGVTVVFNVGGEVSPDSNGFVTIPEGATIFTVKRNGTPIGATIIFW